LLYESLWLSNTDDGKAFLKEKRIDKYDGKQAPNVLEMKIESPDVLDMQWGYFFATGEEAPIRNIISAFNYSKYMGALKKYKDSKKSDEDKKAAYYDSIMYAAAWSLSCNHEHHPRVKEICDNLLKGDALNQTEKSFLKTVLKKNPDKESKNDSNDGHLVTNDAVDKKHMKEEKGVGAMLLFSNDSDKFNKEWDQPTPGIKLTTSETTKRGEKCGVYIIFAGCGINKQGLADVTVDLVVIKPDGKIYAEMKDVTVFKKAPVSNKNLQLSDENLIIVIEKNDPDGVYEVQAKVKDNIKNVALDLKLKFSVDKDE
jgi:hypothetical protein